MKRIIFPVLISILISCEPAWEPFETFVIPKGEHSKNFPVQMLQSDLLKFDVIFDESAIYTSVLPENQWDTHKLLGFSDCNSYHHDNSARFGWRWLNDQLEILAYCYVNEERIIQELGTIQLNVTNHMELMLTDDSYIFSLNYGEQVYIKREKPCNTGAYYMLFPFFGGDEVAPHDITIRINIVY